MKTFQELIDKSREYDQDKLDLKGTANTFTFVPGTASVLLQATDKESEVAISPFGLRDKAWADVCAKLGPAVWGRGEGKSLPREFLMAAQRVSPVGTAQMLQDALVKANGTQKEWYVRTYQSEVRAVLSTMYADIRNTAILERIAPALDFIDEARAKKGKPPVTRNIGRSWLTPDEMTLRIGLLNTDPHDPLLPPLINGNPPYEIGCFIGNSEIGTKSVSVSPYMKRGSCDNSMVMDAKNSYRQVHLGMAQIVSQTLAAAIGGAMRFSENFLHMFLNAQQVEIPDFAEYVTGLAERNGWEDLTGHIVEGAEGGHTVYHLINGITAAAQAKGINEERSLALELFAGAALHSPVKVFGKQPWVYDLETVVAPVRNAV